MLNAIIASAVIMIFLAIMQRLYCDVNSSGCLIKFIFVIHTILI